LGEGDGDAAHCPSPSMNCSNALKEKGRVLWHIVPTLPTTTPLTLSLNALFQCVKGEGDNA